MSVVCRVQSSSSGAALMTQYNLPRPTMHDLLAALHMLFGAHQFVLVHPEAPTTIHPRARMLLSELAPGAIWPCPQPNRPLNEVEQFQLAHTAAYLYPTNAAVDTLASAPGFAAWLQRQQYAQATDPAFKYISPQKEPEIAAPVPRPTTPAAAPVKPVVRAVTANPLAAAQLSAAVASASPSAVAASSKSPYLTPSSSVIASLLRGTKFQPAVVPTGQISSLPPKFVPAPAAPTPPTDVAPASVPSPKHSSLSSKPPPSAVTSQAASLPSVGDPSSWAMPFRLWMLRNYEPIPASVIEAAASKHSNTTAAAPDDTPMFFIDTAGAGADPAPAPSDPGAASKHGADELQQISPSASVLWAEFAQTISWSGGVVPKRPKHLSANADETAQKIWGVPAHLGSSFLWGNKTLKLQKKQHNSNNNSATAATSAPAPAAAASVAADPLLSDFDMPPLETPSGEQVSAARLTAASASVAPLYRVGDIVDCCDLTHFWLEAEILNVDPMTGYRVTFLGYESKWDETIGLEAAKDRIAPRYTHVAKPKHAAKIKAEKAAVAAAAPAALAAAPSASPPIPRADPKSPTFRYLDTTIPYTSVAGLEDPTALNPFGIPGWHLPARKMLLSSLCISELVARQVRVTYVFDGKSMLHIDSMCTSFANDIDARIKLKSSEWERHVRKACIAMGVEATDAKYPLPGFRRREGMFHLLKDSKIALRAHLGGVDAINSAAAAGEHVAEKTAEVAAASAANAVRAPKEWTPQPPVLLAPTDANPLGLTPGPSPSSPPRVLSDAVVTELFLRWMRVAYQFSAKKSTPIAALMDQLRKDVPEEFGVIRMVRVGNLLPDAIGVLYGLKAAQRASVLAQLGKFPITRRIQATCITTRLATATEVAEANINLRVERKRVHDMMNPTPAQIPLTVELEDADGPLLGDTDGPSADQTEATEQASTIAQPPSSKRQRNGSAADSTVVVASSTVPVSSESGDTASLSALAEYNSTQAALAKVVKSLGKTTASVADLTEQERTLSEQLDAVRAKKARKQAKLVALIAQEKHLDQWITLNSPQAKAAKIAKAAAKATKKSNNSPVQPQPQQEHGEELESVAADVSRPAPSPPVSAVVAPIPAPAAAAAADSAMVDVAVSSGSCVPPASVNVADGGAFDDLPVPELPPQLTQEAMADAEESQVRDTAASSEAAGRLAVASPLFTLASPSPVASAASPASAPTPTAVAIRVATVSDAAAVSAFLHRQFNDTFAPHNTESDMLAYCTSAFSPAIQASEIADPNVTVFLAETASGQLVGVAMTRAGSVEPCVSDPTALEVQRIYGVGVGRPLMRACLRHALWLGHRCTFLGVWEHNKRALAFYSRWGYRDVGSHIFPLGSDMQTDRIMQRDVDPTHPGQEPPSTTGAGEVSDFVPLPAEAATLSARVLHAITHAPHTQMEREHGVSVLQIACWLRVTEAQVNEECTQLCQKQQIRPTRDQQHFKATQ